MLELGLQLRLVLLGKQRQKPLALDELELLVTSQLVVGLLQIKLLVEQLQRPLVGGYPLERFPRYLIYFFI